MDMFVVFVVFVCVIVCVCVIAINDRVIHFVQLIINMHIYLFLLYTVATPTDTTGGLLCPISI